MKHLEAAALEVAWGIAQHGAKKFATEDELIAKVSEIYPKVLKAIPKPKAKFAAKNLKDVFKDR